MKLANAPCSWGVIEDIETPAITYSSMLNEMQETGYKGTELGGVWGFMPTDPDLLKNELASRGLSLVGGWVSVSPENEDMHNQDAEEALRAARLMCDVGGTEAVVVLGARRPEKRANKAGRIAPSDALKTEQMELYAKAVSNIAEKIFTETGLKSAYHPHAATWIETPEETAALMNLTPPSLVGICADTGHTHFGGGDAVQIIERYAERLYLVHLKDVDPVVLERVRSNGWHYEKALAEGVFCELGQGEVDFVEVANTLKKIGYNGWVVVEQDVDPHVGGAKENAARNYEYLASVLA